jgi:hypothetical protein
MKTTYCAIIAGGSESFRTHLKKILKMVEKESNDFSLKISEVLSMYELEKNFLYQPDMVFIDSSFVIESSQRLSQAWKKINFDCAFALLLSDNNAPELKNVILEMEKHKSLPTEIHILKNNYPDELIMRVILRMIEFGVVQKNMAVV